MKPLVIMSDFGLADGAVACLWYAVSCGVIGTLLLFAYAKIRPKKGSLSKEQE